MSSFIDRIKLTFLDKDNSFAVPELSATAAAISMIAAAILSLAAFVRSVWFKDQAPDYAGLGAAIGALSAGIGAVVVALGVAQRIRDGLWKKEDIS